MAIDASVPAQPTGQHILEATDALRETVSPLMLSVIDIDLAERVGRALRATGYPPLWCIEPAVRELRVTLRGQVPSYYMKQKAQTVVLGIPGVREVCNDVDVACLR